MPSARTKEILEHIRDSAQFILDATRDKTIDDFERDRVLRNAVERNFEIIGEAIRRLTKLDDRTAQRITEYRRIVDFRNVLIHGYDLVDNDLVWDTVRVQLPVLYSEILGLLSEN
jgi:uncharacterized protein with HEPN domain